VLARALHFSSQPIVDGSAGAFHTYHSAHRHTERAHSMATQKGEKIIGIDLGTTNSVVAVMEGKEPKVIAK